MSADTFAPTSRGCLADAGMLTHVTEHESETETTGLFLSCPSVRPAHDPSVAPYLVFLPLDGALQLVQLVLQLGDDVRLGPDLVELRLPLALQQGPLHLRLEEKKIRMKCVVVKWVFSVRTWTWTLIWINTSPVSVASSPELGFRSPTTFQELP